MKVLHTADWHLGAKLEGRDRILEQKDIVSEIIKIADDYDVSSVIISGDIFHNSTPSAEAENLFFDAVDALSLGGDRLIFVIPGNHDDALRLGASKRLAQKHNILIASSLEKFDITNLKHDSRTRVIDSGDGFIRVKNGQEEMVIAYLPFFGEAKCRELAGNQLSYGQSVKKLSEIGASHFSSEAFNVFVSHLFVVGGKLAENEEVSVGQALAVSVNDLPQNAHYIALGHLHRGQLIGKNVYYSGSTISLRFKDLDPRVLVVEGDKTGLINVIPIKLKKACKLKKIRVNNIAFAYKELSYTSNNELVELTFVQNNPLKASEVKDLKRQFPNLVSVRLELTRENEANIQTYKRREMNDKDLFVEFYKHTVGAEPCKRLVDMFLEIKEESDVTD